MIYNKYILELAQVKYAKDTVQSGGVLLNQNVAKSLSPGHTVYLKSKQRALHDLTESWLFARNILPLEASRCSRSLKVVCSGLFLCPFHRKPDGSNAIGFLRFRAHQKATEANEELQVVHLQKVKISKGFPHCPYHL